MKTHEYPCQIFSINKGYNWMHRNLLANPEFHAILIFGIAGRSTIKTVPFRVSYE
jgi:hypothetical protein